MSPNPLARLFGRIPEAPSVDALRARFGERYKWILLAVVMVGTIAAILTSTIVNVALPAIAQHFEVGAERVQWVSSAHMAAMTVAMLLVPWSLGRFGFRRVFFCALALLVAGSLLGGVVPSFGLLIVLRALQGAAAGLLQPLATVLVLRAFPPEVRGRALGIFGFGVVLAPAAGPTVGGVLVDAFGWRAVFFVSLPFALIGWVLALKVLPRMSTPRDERPFDLFGFALLCAFVVTMLESFVRLHDYGFLSLESARWVGATVVLLAGWIFWERRHSAPLVDLNVFAIDSFRIGVIVALIYGMGLFGSTLLVPGFVQGALAYSATDAGTLLLPAGLALAVTIPLAGRLADRFEARWLVVLGLALFALSFLLIAAWPAATFGTLAAILLVGRVGLGVILPSLSLGTVQQVPPALVASASSMFNFARLLGGAAGTSALAIFVEARARAGDAAQGVIESAPSALPRASTASIGSQIDAYRLGFLVLAALFTIAAVIASRMHETAIRTETDIDQ